MKHQTSIEMTKFLSAVARRLGVADIWRLVGGENLKGEVIEIANARRESYEDSPTSKGKG